MEFSPASKAPHLCTPTRCPKRNQRCPVEPKRNVNQFLDERLAWHKYRVFPIRYLLLRAKSKKKGYNSSDGRRRFTRNVPRCCTSLKSLIFQKHQTKSIPCPPITESKHERKKHNKIKLSVFPVPTPATHYLGRPFFGVRGGEGSHAYEPKKQSPKRKTKMIVIWLQKARNSPQKILNEISTTFHNYWQPWLRYCMFFSF